MAEKVSRSSAAAVPVKHKDKTVAVSRKALSVINGEINTRKRNLSKLNLKSKQQENLSINQYDAQKFKIFEDSSSNSAAVAEKKSDPEPPAKSCSSSPEFIDESPIYQSFKESLFSYSKKKERNRSDSIWNTPYRPDIYAYLRGVEKRFLPDPHYLEKQSDITMKMRSILVDWFIEVAEEYEMQSQTLHLAVSYVDRFLSVMFVLKEKLQLLGAGCMFLASKYEEIYPPELKDFVFISDNSFTKKQLLRMEHLILKVLNFNISAPTAYTFQQLYCSMCNATESVIYLSQYICELSLVYLNPIHNFRPSIIAAGSVALANYTLGISMWDENITENSGYLLSDLKPVMLYLYEIYSSVGGSAFQAAYEKYRKNKYGGVANIHCPQKLIFPFFML